jgi:hypothetical protein
MWIGHLLCQMAGVQTSRDNEHSVLDSTEPCRLRLDGIGLDDGSHRACNKVYFNVSGEPSTNQFEQGFLSCE